MSCKSSVWSSENLLVLRLGAHRQQFEWSEGQLVSCRSPWLAVGVRAREGGSSDPTGSPLRLLRRNPSDPCQVWISREGERWGNLTRLEMVFWKCLFSIVLEN